MVTSKTAMLDAVFKHTYSINLLEIKETKT